MIKLRQALKTAYRLTVVTIALFAFNSVASAAPCNRACLLEQAKQFNANMLARTTAKVPLGPNAQIRENTKSIALADSKWATVTKILLPREDGLYAPEAQAG